MSRPRPGCEKSYAKFGAWSTDSTREDACCPEDCTGDSQRGAKVGVEHMPGTYQDLVEFAARYNVAKAVRNHNDAKKLSDCMIFLS